MEKKVLPGIFVGYALYAGGIWNGDTLVADVEEIQNLDVSGIKIRRLNAKEVLVPKHGDKFACPCADGTVKLARKGEEA